jgi:hypothetical protein
VPSTNDVRRRGDQYQGQQHGIGGGIRPECLKIESCSPSWHDSTEPWCPWLCEQRRFVGQHAISLIVSASSAIGNHDRSID